MRKERTIVAMTPVDTPRAQTAAVRATLRVGESRAEVDWREWEGQQDAFSSSGTLTMLFSCGSEETR
jgi:hypothetical protein